MTKIEPLTPLSATQLHRRDIGTMVMTLILAGIVVHLWPSPQEAKANDKAYQVLKAACKFPSKPGEATTYALTGEGLIYCWEMGR
jgi:hypothetical protein